MLAAMFRNVIVGADDGGRDAIALADSW